MTTFLGIILFGTLTLQAQPEYNKGYVVYKNGDTSVCFIYLNPSVLPTDYVEIRNSFEEVNRKISIDTVTSFWVPKFGKFVACNVPLTIPQLTSDKDRYWNEISYPNVFLQELVRGGKFSLYKLGNFRYYLRSNYIREDNGFEELIFRQFDGCCTYDVFQNQILYYLSPKDSYSKVVDYMEYNDPSLKAAVIHLNTASEVESICKNRKVHFFAGAGTTINTLSLGDEHANLSFAAKLAPTISGGILWQSTGAYEKFLNVITVSYTQYNSKLRGWVQDRYNFGSNTHTVYSFLPKYAILYKCLDKFNYRVYGGLSAGYCKTLISNHTGLKYSDVGYLAAKCYNDDALVFRAELLLSFGRYSISLFEQLGKAYDTGTDYQLNPRNSGLLLYYNF